MDVAVLLGCPARPGRLSPAALRRVARAAQLYVSSGGCLVVASGGRSWDDTSTEADCLAEALAARGIPAQHILRERCSMDTRDNATYSVAMLKRRGLVPRWVVTCDTHGPRALSCFRASGAEVEMVLAPSPSGSRRRLAAALEWLRAGPWVQPRLEATS